MRNAGAWHLTFLERSKTVQTITKLMYCNEIKETLKKEEKKEKNFYPHGIEPATSANMDKRWAWACACAAQALGI